jgi:nucleoside-diphosphate-sugar epimerase
METTLIVGCGYLGRRVAEFLQRENGSVLVTAGRPESADVLRGLGYAAHELDLDAGADFTPPYGPYRVLYLVPPPPRGVQDSRLPQLLSALRGHPPLRFVYAGSSAVYGDRQGAWVSETAAVAPQSETAARRLHAERRLMQWCSEQGVTGVILRLAGIYGPRRLPLERLRSARAAVREAEAAWSNRIHVDDLARACIAALQHSSPQTLYNVADGHPSSSTAFLRAVAERTGLPAAPEIPLHEALAQASPAQTRFMLESRRLDVSRMREDLLPDLLFPDFLAGLNSIRDF